MVSCCHGEAGDTLWALIRVSGQADALNNGSPAMLRRCWRRTTLCVARCCGSTVSWSDCNVSNANAFVRSPDPIAPGVAQGPVGMILTRYLSSEGWVEECSHANAFDAYIDARRRCVLRGCPYLLVDAETGSTVSVLTVKQCLHQYGVEGDFPA